MRKCKRCKKMVLSFKNLTTKYCKLCVIEKKKTNYMTYKGRYDYGDKHNKKYRMKKIFEKIRPITLMTINTYIIKNKGELT